MATPSAERLTPLEPKEEFTIGQNGHETITNGGQQHMNPLLATNPAAEAAMAAVAGLRTQGGQPDRTPASGGAEAGDDDDDSDDEEPPALEESTDSDSDDDSNDQAAVEAAVMAERRRSARKLRDAERRLAELEAKMREQELQREREQKDALAEMVQKLNAKNDALQAELKVKQEPREHEIETEAAVRKAEASARIKEKRDESNRNRWLKDATEAEKAKLKTDLEQAQLHSTWLPMLLGHLQSRNPKASYILTLADDEWIGLCEDIEFHSVAGHPPSSR